VSLIRKELRIITPLRLETCFPVLPTKMSAQKLRKTSNTAIRWAEDDVENREETMSPKRDEAQCSKKKPNVLNECVKFNIITIIINLKINF